jgi:hypothetical protein
MAGPLRKATGFPVQPGDRIFTALLVGIIPMAGATVVLILCYRPCRMVLDRHRLADHHTVAAPLRRRHAVKAGYLHQRTGRGPRLHGLSDL